MAVMHLVSRGRLDLDISVLGSSSLLAMVGWTEFQMCLLRVGSPSENGGLLTIFTIAHSDAALAAAAPIFGWLWPKFVTEYIERKSMYSFPSTSHALDPWALMRATCPAYGCQIV